MRNPHELRHRWRLGSAVLVAIGALLIVGGGLWAPSPAFANVRAQQATLKPDRAADHNQANSATMPNLATAPRVAAAPALTGPSITLTASGTDFWPGQTATLKATANFDVGPTRYAIMIFDVTSPVSANRVLIGACKYGTTCQATVTHTSGGYSYQAYIATWANNLYPPSNIVAQSGYVSMGWGIANHPVGLTFSSTTVAPGSTVTITLRTRGADIGPSPYFFTIFDATTATRVSVCGYGTSCTATVSQNVAGTHQYIGYLGSNSTAFPPSQIVWQTRPGFVTWSSGGFTVSLAPSPTYAITATANKDVGPTPYYIFIYDITTGTRIGFQGSGTTLTLSSLPCGHSFVAFVGRWTGTLLPPPDTQASSAVIQPYFCL